MVDESLFWPDNDAASFGPNLEVLEVMFHIARLDGKWYFQGPGGEGRNAVGFEISESYPPFETSEVDVEMDGLYDESPWGCEDINNSQFRIKPHESSLRPLFGRLCQSRNTNAFFKASYDLVTAELARRRRIRNRLRKVRHGR